MDGYKILTESLSQNNDHPLSSLFKEESYQTKVRNNLWRIFEDTRGISEKDFKGQEELKKICDGLVIDPNIAIIIERFESDKLRPSYCAECIYSKLKSV